MAVINTGLGWEADENYLKRYSGKIGSINTITSSVLPACPVASTPSDVVANGFELFKYNANSAGTQIYHYYAACTKPGGRLFIFKHRSGVYYPAILHPDNTAELIIVRLTTPTQAQSSQTRSIDTATSTTGVYCGYAPGIGGPTASSAGLVLYAPSYDGNPNATPGLDYAANAAMQDCSLLSADIEKAADGYAVVAWVRYKWQGGYGDIDETPILISTDPAAAAFGTLPSGIVPSGANMYYQGAIFRFNWLYNLEGAAPFSILTLDYSGSAYGELTEQELFPLIARSVSLRVPIAPDPYGGGTGPGGGTGDGPGDSTPVPHPTAPTISAVDTGLVTLYVPTLSELQSLAQFLWSGLFDLDTWRKIFADPMDAILGLMMLPVAVPAGSSVAIRVGNQTTSVSAARALGQYVTVSCGSIDLGENVGCYLDYDPFTQISMYLPYIGFVPLKADDCIGRTLNLQYIIDCLTGACVATLTAGGSVVGSWAGNCATQIPITSSSWNNVISGALSIAATAAALAGGATAVAPLAVANMANTAINSQKPTISRSGALGGSAGFMGVQIPYLIVTRPRPAIPGGQNQEIGYPSYINELLGSLQGYTIVDEIHLSGIPGTQAELEEIQELLAGGVIL